jgi:hypothetical protein
MSKLIAGIAGVLVLAVAGYWIGNESPASADSYSPYVSADGVIRLPENLRTEFVHMGSWFVPEGDSSGFHDVYTQRSTIEAYRTTGKFPDGAVLVKELRASTAGSYTTGGNVGHANDTIKQWFMMVKDTKGRFPDNPLWGEGWGWALFKPDDPAKNVATSFQIDCLACHIPAKQNDWVYIEAYPTLRK